MKLWYQSNFNFVNIVQAKEWNFIIMFVDSSQNPMKLGWGLKNESFLEIKPWSKRCPKYQYILDLRNIKLHNKLDNRIHWWAFHSIFRFFLFWLTKVTKKMKILCNSWLVFLSFFTLVLLVLPCKWKTSYSTEGRSYVSRDQ